MTKPFPMKAVRPDHSKMCDGIIYTAQKKNVIDLAPKRLARIRRETEMDYHTRYNPERFLNSLSNELF